MDDLYLPPNIGIPIGDSPTIYNYFTLEIHYNNLDHVAGLVDSSGVEVTFTGQLRPINAGTLSLGDTGISAPSIPAQETCAHYEFTCSPTCSQEFPQSINVIQSFIHMHQAGSMGWTSHWRGDQNLGIRNRIEYWDFGHQHQIRMNFTIQPGDR